MKKILLTAYLLSLSVIAFANKTDTLVINDTHSSLLTNRYFYELEDPTGTLNINQVFNNSKFHSIKEQLPVLKMQKPLLRLI